MRAWLAVSIVLVVAGTVVVAATDATVPSAIGFAAIGLGGVLLMGLAFYAVGLSEDRDRERRDRR